MIVLYKCSHAEKMWYTRLATLLEKPSPSKNDEWMEKTFKTLQQAFCDPHRFKVSYGVSSFYGCNKLFNVSRKLIEILKEANTISLSASGAFTVVIIAYLMR